MHRSRALGYLDLKSLRAAVLVCRSKVFSGPSQEPIFAYTTSACRFFLLFWQVGVIMTVTARWFSSGKAGLLPTLPVRVTGPEQNSLKVRGFNKMYHDKVLVCQDCGEEFIFTAGEQEFYAEKGFENEPKRCKVCRQKRSGNGRAPREMHIAVCAACGGEAQVPFRPVANRPVYCQECFAKQKAL